MYFMYMFFSVVKNQIGNSILYQLLENNLFDTYFFKADKGLPKIIKLTHLKFSL